MAPLPTVAASRTLAQAVKVSARALSTTAARPVAPSGEVSSSYTSPFKGAQKTTQVPNFNHYMTKKSPSTVQLFQYFMVGTMGAISAAGAKSTIQGEFMVLWRNREGIEGWI
jgi:ubiquinol-cytochrome c reductase iron-sulfur subunit